jgi:hypothetical protein
MSAPIFLDKIFGIVQLRVRYLISKKKVVETDTKWSKEDMPPKHHPIYQKTKPV